jgi:glycerol-3-phosphate cytidylyltransferase-like family protein
MADHGTLGHMLVLRETMVLADSVLEIELHDDLRYRLSWRGVVYENKRRYEFRSVEQLRYDFERDAKAA